MLIGRAYAYGLAAGGETGVTRALEILRGDIVRTLKLLGCPSVTELDGSYVSTPSGWQLGEARLRTPLSRATVPLG